MINVRIKFETLPLSVLKYIIEFVSKKPDYKLISIEEISNIIKVMPFSIKEEMSLPSISNIRQGRIYYLYGRIFGQEFCIALNRTDFINIKYIELSNISYTDYLNNQSELEDELRTKLYNRIKNQRNSDSGLSIHYMKTHGIIMSNSNNSLLEDQKKIEEYFQKQEIAKREGVKLHEEKEKHIKKEKPILELKQLNLKKLEI